MIKSAQTEATYKIIDSYFSDKQSVGKDIFTGFKLVEYKNGEHGLIYKNIQISTNPDKRHAHSIEGLSKKGSLEDLRVEFHKQKAKSLGLKYETELKKKPFDLKENQRMEAVVQSVTRNHTDGKTQVMMKVNDRTLSLRLKNEHAIGIEKGRNIVLTKNKEGIKLSIVQNRKLSLKR